MEGIVRSLPDGFRALVIGASGGIGAAVVEHLKNKTNCGQVEAIARSEGSSFDLIDERTIIQISRQLLEEWSTFHLIFDATGALTIDGVGPEKSLAALNPDKMAKAFALNAIGPILLFKHLTPLLPIEGKSVFATLSAKVGSISDNRLGGWYSYRASKAALNQIVKTAAIEISRKRPEAVCIALHPGTVETPLSQPYSRGRYTHTPDEAARHLVEVLDQTRPDMSGAFLDYDGNQIDW